MNAPGTPLARAAEAMARAAEALSRADPRRRTLVGWGLIGGGAVAVAWFLPATAVLLAWPFLFAVPGWWLVTRSVPTMAPPARIGLGIVVSVFVSAHLVNVVSLGIGFTRLSVLVSVVVLAVATAVLATRELPRLAPPPPLPTRASIADAIRGNILAFGIAAIVGLAVLLVLGLNGWRETPRGWVSGGWNWSDLLVHVAIGQSLIHGNFPPQVPYFAGMPLTYHWFADFHGAIAASVAGINLIPVYFVTSALFAAVLALLVWELARRLTGDRRVATIATILVCFGGGMGWLRLAGDLMAGDGSIGDLVSSRPYDNSWAPDWPFFRIASIFGTGFLPHRATTLGLPGLVAAVLLLAVCLNRRPAGVLLAGVIAALLAPFQFYAFPATYLIAGLYVLATRAWREPTFRRDAALFLAPAVLALPFIAGAVFQQGARGAFHPVIGWGEARFGEGPFAALFFYVTNLGLPMFLALAALTRPAPSRRFLGLWLAALFLVPNVVVVSAVDFDMNKYFQMMWIAVAILAAWLIKDLPRPAIAGVLVFAAISPALIAVYHATHEAVTMSPAQEAAGRWIERNTPERAVFVTDAFINSPVDLAGRLRLTTFGPYVANLGYDPTERERDTGAIYCDGPGRAAELMRKHGAGYVLSSGSFLQCEGGAPTDFRSSPLFETLYDRDGVAVFRLRT